MVAEIIVVFHIASQRIARADGWAGDNVGCDSEQANGPLRNRRTSVGREIACAVCAVAEHIAGNHPADAAAGIVGNAVTIRPVNRKAIRHPAENRRMFRRRVGGFGKRLRICIVIHMIADQITQRRRIRVVMISAGILLVRVARVKRRAFVHIRVAVPIISGVPGADFRRAVPRKRVPTVEHLHAVHEDADLSAAADGFRGRHAVRARQAVKNFLVHRQVRKRAVLPRTHRVACQPGAAHIDRVCRGIHFLHAAIRRRRLGLCAIAPGRQRRAGAFHRVIGVDARVLAGISSEPAVRARIGGSR